MGARISAHGADTPDDAQFEWPPKAEYRPRVPSELGQAPVLVSSAAAERVSNAHALGSSSTSVQRRSKSNAPADGLSTARAPAGQRVSASRRWRLGRADLVAFGLCAIVLGAAGWYAYQITPVSPIGNRAGVAQASAGPRAALASEHPGEVTGQPARSLAHSPAAKGATVLDTRTGDARSGLRSASAAATGTLVIKSEPEGARILLDGRTSGVTPATFRQVVAGEHRIALTHGALQITQVARVERGATVTVVASLQAPSIGSGWVAATSPLELDVLEGGELLGTTRSRRIMLQEGQHTLEFSNAEIGYRGAADVRIVAGEVTPLRITLPSSVVHVNAIPWAEVWIDGQRMGETPIGNLQMDVGVHEVRFRHPELGEKTVSIMVKPGAPTRVTANLRMP